MLIDVKKDYKFSKESNFDSGLLILLTIAYKKEAKINRSYIK